MSAKILDGTKLAKNIRAIVATDRAALPFTPKLVAILVGNDPASQLYVSLKEKACAEAGIAFQKIELPETATQDEVEQVISKANEDQEVDAILLQLPLPTQLDADTAIIAIAPEKDVDGFHPDNLHELSVGIPRVVPPTIAGIVELLRSTGEVLRDKNALIVAKADSVFIAPLFTILSREGLHCGNATPDATDLIDRLRRAEVVITLAGIPGLLRGEMLTHGAIVIDVATVRTSDGKLTGDTDRASVTEKAAWLSPVPGGVGPMTVAMLLKNVLTLARARRS